MARSELPQPGPASPCGPCPSAALRFCKKRSPGGQLGDAYFHHGELATPPTARPACASSRTSTTPTAASAWRTRSGCASWRRATATRSPLLCSHDPHELDLRAGRRRRRARRERRGAREALGALRRAGRALAPDRVHALARGRARARASTTTTSSGAGRSTTSRASGRRSGTSSRCRPTATLERGARQPRDAGRRVVRRHQPQLRRARLRRQGRRRDGDPARLRAARARRAELGRAARPGRRRRRRPARARGRARRPRRRLHAEHPRGDRRLPRQRQRSARSGRAARPTSARPA